MTLVDGGSPTGAPQTGRGFGFFGFRYEGVVAFAGLAVVWQIVSLFVPHFLFPSIPEIAERLLAIFTSGKSIADALATSARILAGLGGAFVLGTLLALPMARSVTFERYVYPLLNFNQGIPALSWVVIAIIWFRGIEFRIFFIMVMTTLPAFTFQVLDAYRTMSKDLFEMTLAFRPTRLDLFRTLIWPTVLPGILTAWKVNLGNAARVVVVAELVGATGGVGYELLQQQQLFDMAGAVAWTLVLVIFVLIVQSIITLIETRALRYRAFAEHAS
jgi:NitT/TauT family transport system permease protein